MKTTTRRESYRTREEALKSVQAWNKRPLCHAYLGEEYPTINKYVVIITTPQPTPTRQ